MSEFPSSPQQPWLSRHWRLVPITVGPILGVVGLVGWWAGFYRIELAGWIFILLSLLTVTGLVACLAWLLSESDRQRILVEGALRDSKSQIEARVRERNAELAVNYKTTQERDIRLGGSINSARDAIIGLGLDGLVTSWNAGAERMFGIPAARILGHSIGQIVPRDRRVEESQLLEQVRSGKRVEAFETMRLRGDGEQIAVSLSVFPILDRPGQVIGAFKIARDITERKRADEALRISEERFRRYFELGLIGMAITSPTQVCGEVNDQFCKILGYQKAEIVGKTWTDLTHPDDRSVGAAMLREVLEGKREGYSLDQRFLRRDGQPIHATISLNCVRRPNGAVDYFVALLQDITDRKSAEEKLAAERNLLRTVIDQLPDYIYLKDAKGCFRLLNQANLELIGLSSMEEVIGRTVYDFFPMDMARAYTADDLAVLGSGEPILNREEPIVSEDGSRRWLLTTKVPLRDSSGQISGLVGISRDTTERRRADEGLRLFRTLVDQSDDAFEVIDPNTGRFLDVNERECVTLGYSRGELLGLRVSDIDPTIKRSAWPQWAERIQTAGSWSGEGRHRRKDGTTFPVEFNAKWVRLHRDYIVMVVRDISERVRVHKAAAREQARFRFIFDSMPVGILWMERGNPSSRMVNPAHVRLTGVPADSCQQLELYRQATHPDDRARHDEFLLRLARDERDCYTLEQRYLRADGTVYWAELTVRVFKDPSTGESQELSTLVDVTPHKLAVVALRESETRFRQLAENIEEVFWMTDPVTQAMLYISPAYETIWGRPCELLYQKPGKFAEAVHPADQQRIVEAIANKQSRGDYDEVYRIVRPDGSWRWIRDRAYPICDAEGHVYRIVGTAEDITARCKLEEQYREAQKMKAIGTLAGGIAHDFNNILTAISGFTELAQSLVKDQPEVEEYLASARQASARAAELVRQILTFSRQKDQQRGLVQLRPLVAEPLKLLRASIPSTIVFDVELASDLPTVLADPTQIHQVLMNLCTNAGHAMKGLPGRLTVRLQPFIVDALLAEANPKLRLGTYVRLTVSDTGCGMDRVTLEHIFEPFFTTKAPGEGTGLGLSVVHGIMHRHEGVITVYSEPGEGTTFHLYFPAYAVEVAEPTIEVVRVPSGQGQSILLVDDEKQLVVIGRKMLERLNYVVECKTDVTEALEAVRADPTGFDLVITDLTMPGMTGTDFARRLLEIRPDLPIILTTGYGANLTSETVRALGIRELLSKPHNAQALGMAVQRALREQNPIDRPPTNQGSTDLFGT